MSGEEWAIFKWFFRARTGHPLQHHRRALDAVFWIARTGAPWRDLFAEFGHRNLVFQQFRR